MDIWQGKKELQVPLECILMFLQISFSGSHLANPAGAVKEHCRAEAFKKCRSQVIKRNLSKPLTKNMREND